VKNHYKLKISGGVLPSRGMQIGRTFKREKRGDWKNGNEKIHGKTVQGGQRVLGAAY